MTNTELLNLLEKRLIEKGFPHSDDRDDLFLHEVFNILKDHK
ncbi:hypothetical protein GCM10007063_05950 [Lentibacillus kapialis]|uniref:Uncharacterized protein n=1 Tax=Lentibacillus kapialis TaxID=340214 RepID=A0A917UUL9_9BACI|nr:hypothetical protein [Lentibacillus kapialis]GGJ86259.1 hypothetical protein GCM10007063_05950 [Lentibacillus kapialis]